MKSKVDRLKKADSEANLKSNSSSEQNEVKKHDGRSAILYARALLEKCDIVLAKDSFLKALSIAKKNNDIGLEVESLTGLLRVSAERDELEETQKFQTRIESLIERAPLEVLPSAYYCLGVVFRYKNNTKEALKNYRLALKFAKKLNFAASTQSLLIEDFVRIWTAIINMSIENAHQKRSALVIEFLLKKYGDSTQTKGVLGPLYFLKARISELQGQYDEAKELYQNAHSHYMMDLNWYASIYIFYAYSRIYRKTRNFKKAYWNLDLALKAVGDRFLNLKKSLMEEKERLSNDAVDLLIDSRSLLISTREKTELNLGKQYILLGILEALTEAHNRTDKDADHGLSKAEIIERVWKEKYRPEAHDNKLYYNINRLRKLIEVDVKHPKYLLNWREGYRLSPELKVHYIQS